LSSRTSVTNNTRSSRHVRRRRTQARCNTHRALFHALKSRTAALIAMTHGSSIHRIVVHHGKITEGSVTVPRESRALATVIRATVLRATVDSRNSSDGVSQPSLRVRQHSRSRLSRVLISGLFHDLCLAARSMLLDRV
jgi:hypothetical protein